MFILDYTGGPNVKSNVLDKRARVREDDVTTKAEVREREGRERFEDTTLPASKMEEGVTSQGMQAALRSWKSQKNKQTDFLLRSSKRNTGRLTSCL